MKIKSISMLFSFFLSLTLLLAFFSGLAKAEPANLQIIDTSYYLYNVKSNPSEYFYKINVTFYNSGDGQSDRVNIKLFEDGNPTVWPDECHDVSFGPHENKTFTFNWSTPLTYKTVEIIYKPSKANTPETKYNSGNVTIEIGSKPTTVNKTPGFEFSLAIIILSIVICLKYFKMKKYN